MLKYQPGQTVTITLKDAYDGFIGSLYPAKTFPGEYVKYDNLQTPESDLVHEVNFTDGKGVVREGFFFADSEISPA